MNELLRLPNLLYTLGVMINVHPSWYKLLSNVEFFLEYEGPHTLV